MKKIIILSKKHIMLKELRNLLDGYFVRADFDKVQVRYSQKWTNKWWAELFEQISKAGAGYISEKAVISVFKEYEIAYRRSIGKKHSANIPNNRLQALELRAGIIHTYWMIAFENRTKMRAFLRDFHETDTERWSCECSMLVFPFDVSKYVPEKEKWRGILQNAITQFILARRPYYGSFSIEEEKLRRVFEVTSNLTIMEETRTYVWCIHR